MKEEINRKPLMKKTGKSKFLFCFLGRLKQVLDVNSKQLSRKRTKRDANVQKLWENSAV